jgi:insertion element IS1 protein InsB
VSGTEVWMWKVINKFTGDLIDWECGGRDRETLRRLMQRLKDLKILYFHTDGLPAYAAEISENQLYQGKDATHLIESNNAPQRHWFARFRRRTCVVSRSIPRILQALRIYAAVHVNKNCNIPLHIL